MAWRYALSLARGGVASLVVGGRPALRRYAASILVFCVDRSPAATFAWCTVSASMWRGLDDVAVEGGFQFGFRGSCVRWGFHAGSGFITFGGDKKAIGDALHSGCVFLNFGVVPELGPPQRQVARLDLTCSWRVLGNRFSAAAPG